MALDDEQPVGLRELHPGWVSGAAVGRPWLDVLVALLISPFSLCAGTVIITGVAEFVFHKPWYGPVIPLSAVLGFLMLLVGLLSLWQQRSTKIRLGERLLFTSRLRWHQHNLAWAGEMFDSYQRQLWRGRDKGCLGLVVSIGCGVVLLGGTIGMCAVLLELWGVQFGVKEHEVIGYLMNTLVDFISIALITLPALLLLFVYQQVMRSDEIVAIWCKERKRGIRYILCGPADLRILASKEEADAIETWLNEANIPRLHNVSADLSPPEDTPGGSARCATSSVTTRVPPAG